MACKRLSLMLEECEEASEEQLQPEKENIDSNSSKRYKTYEKSTFESPLQRMLQRHISISSNTLSPITELSHNMRDTLLDGGGTPKSSTLRSYNSLSSYDSSNSLDDEYMAMFEQEAFEQMPLNKVPGDLHTLITGQLKTNPDVPKQRNHSTRRCLSMSQQDVLDDILPPVCNEKNSLDSSSAASNTPIRKTVSMNDADILNALNDEPELIGDLSKACALPVLLSGVRHRDLKTISCDTLARLIRGEYENLLSCYTIIDCRYPYEFDGGHIRGALNLYTRAQISDAFPRIATNTDQTIDQRRIYVFHCEFSSERGPKLLRFLRSKDRNVHTHNYPSLDYPELYLLNNGYKEFFTNYSQLCEPANYVPMLAPAYNEEYRVFRAKTKSWQCGDNDGGDSGIGGADGSLSGRSRILCKSRSRLLYAE